MVLIRKEGGNMLVPYATIKKLCEAYPEFSLRYLRNVGLGPVGFNYKGYIIYRVRK